MENRLSVELGWRDVRILRTALAAISAALACQSLVVLAQSIAEKSQPGILDSSACVVIFTIYPIWFRVRQKRSTRV